MLLGGAGGLSGRGGREDTPACLACWLWWLPTVRVADHRAAARGLVVCAPHRLMDLCVILSVAVVGASSYGWLVVLLGGHRMCGR